LRWLLILLLTSLEFRQGPADSQAPASPPAKSEKPAKPENAPKAKNRDKVVPNTTTKGQTAKRDDALRVKTAAEMQSAGSSFLLPPGSPSKPDGRYSKDVPDPNGLPPWRQSSFFGVRTSGQFFVYVIDCSESMIDDDRFARATIELRRSVLALQPPQKFEVIFYNKSSIPMPGGPIPRTADQTEKGHLLAWLRLIEPLGTTDPRRALTQALSLRPDAVYLLSDGEFPKGTVEDVIVLNARNIPIHCIDLSGGLGGNHLERIARSSGGRYASRPVNNLRGSP
jgi:hypothetical protein